eukprot:6120245-Ditylum_brightwellii.AAC.1
MPEEKKEELIAYIDDLDNILRNTFGCKELGEELDGQAVTRKFKKYHQRIPRRHLQLSMSFWPDHH